MSEPRYEITGVPKEVKTELLPLFEENGENGVTPEMVEELARNPKSACYQYFEWDDKKGAYDNRLNQARQLLNRIKVRVIVDDQEPVKMRGVINIVRDDDKRAYVLTPTAVQNDHYREQHRQRLLARLRALKNELEIWDDFSGVVSAIDIALDKSA